MCSQPLVNTDDPATTAQKDARDGRSRHPPPALDLDTVLKREIVTGALTAARQELADLEAQLAPLKENIDSPEQALVRLDGKPTPATRRTLTDAQRAERAAKQRARREARTRTTCCTRRPRRVRVLVK